MPTIKSQVVRYRIINESFRGPKKYWTKDELIDKINQTADIDICKRTIDGDIHQMRHSTQLNYYAPIAFSKRDGGYYYEDPGYSIDKITLNDKDIQALEFATATLMQYRNFSILNDFTGTVDKLISLVNHIKSTNHEAYFSFIDFEKAPALKGSEYLDDLVDAIKNKRVIELSYQKFDDDEIKVHLMSPYLLKEYRNRWYLLGLLHKRQSIITFGLDRITKLDFLDNQSFIDSHEFNSELYFKNTLGVSFTQDPFEEIVLSFTPNQGKYIKAQALHVSQEVLVDDSTEFRIKLLLVPNYELTSTILSYGKDVKVISPQTLKEKIAEQLSHCYGYYNLNA